MGTRQGLVRIGQRVVALVATVLMVFGTVSCAKPTEPTQLISEPRVEPNRLAGKLAEVSPPETIQTLKQIIDAYTPQVRILSPRPGEIVEDTSVSLRVQVRGLPLFKDETFGLGPHLHVFLDNEPYTAVYDLSEPLEFEDLTPGTHTLRVFASRPWHESFKNQGAFDQRTFHIYAPTPQDELSADKPVLTYSRPQGTYGAEPIMLDFYLTNAPLHMTAQEDPKDDVHDWRIRCTVNGQSFVFDEWQAIYLKGFEPGRNWVQLELIDEAGNPIDNRFNNTVRVIDYEPGGEDTLAKLVRGELSLKEVASIIDPTYEPPAEPEPEPEETAPEADMMPETEESGPEAEKKSAPAEEAAPAEEEAAETETVPTEATPEPEAEAVPPTKPQSPAVVPPVAPAAPEPDGLKASETSDLEPETASEKPQQGTQAEDSQASQIEAEPSPEAEVQEQSDEAEVPAAEVEKSNPTEEETIQPPDSEETVPTLSEDKVIDQEQPSEQQDSTVEEQIENLLEEAVQAEDQEVSPESNKDLDELIEPETTETETQDESTQQSTGNKLLERYKRWQQRRQSTQPEAKQPIVAPNSDRVDVFLSPAAETSPELSQPEDADSDDVKMDMPDLVEPYLTEPYLTEPRLDLANPKEAPADTTPEESTPQPPTPNSEGGTSPGQPLQTNPDRPFI